MDLVPNRWYAILDATEVPKDKPVRFERAGRQLVLWRSADGVVSAADDRCPHRGAALSTGYLRDGQLQCRYHGFRFDGTGACTLMPAHPEMRIPSRMALDTCVVREEHDLIWLWTGARGQETATIPFFDVEGMSCAGSKMTKSWPTHYARVVENELDWGHLPFVHHNTIGRGMDPRVDVEVEVDGDRIRSWSARLGPEGFVELLAPNVWRLMFSSGMFNFLAFAPVSDEEMVIYARTYQKTVTVWPLDWLLGKTMALANPFVLAQDFVTVTSQRPKIPGLHNRDVLVPSDKPILEYFRWRKRAKNEEATASADT
jgi:phenylpropionate dioxygenase-like ring-hydroxylating dioxygenase large terminal subunit